MKIMVTGGAGYIGSILTTKLLNTGHRVKVYDSLMHGGSSLLHVINHPNLEFILGDIRDTRNLARELKDCDVIVHLAAIVGYPACEKDPQLAIDVNQRSVRRISRHIAPQQLVLYASTGSNYGCVRELCTEETPLHPLSKYGQTKTEGERIFLNENTAIVYRFATAFGMSYRPRLDLLVNDFVYQALTMKYIVVYESHFMRTFIHIQDMARSFLFAIENADRMKHEVYNVGSDRMNYSKAQVCKIIQEKIDYDLHLTDFGKDMDQRNYVVSYEKISSLGFGTTVSVEEGVDELIKGYRLLKIHNPYKNV